MPGYDYTWVTEPPIEVYTGELAQNLARIGGTRLKRYIARYRTELKTIGDIEKPSATLVNSEDFKSLAPGNVKNAESMCETFEKIDVGASGVYCEYVIAGNPLALMVFNLYKGHAYICDIVVHPAAEFGGQIMLEFAVNYCVSKGTPPILKLWALNETAVGPYRGMGFASKTDEIQDMMLDLTKQNPKWQLLNGKWRYRSSRSPGPKYALTTLVEQ